MIPTPASLCPSCSSELSGAAVPGDPTAQPQPGDLTLCAYCGALLQFDDLLLLNPTTLDAFDDPAARTQAQQLQQQLRDFHAFLKEMKR